jgi:GNAT superfamily N-acetyltransferase
MTNVSIRQADPADANNITFMVGELLGEIMAVIGEAAFHFDADDTRQRLEGFLANDTYTVFIAEQANTAIGFIALTECYALYTEGAFGIIPEFFVRPDFRSQQIGLALITQAKSYACERGWKRLEVTTPPLPEFDKTLAFYQREGFSIAGGRKMKWLI